MWVQGMNEPIAKEARQKGDYEIRGHLGRTGKHEQESRLTRGCWIKEDVASYLRSRHALPTSSKIKHSSAVS